MQNQENPPISLEKGVILFENEQKYKEMLKEFESVDLNKFLQELSAAILNENWQNVQKNAHFMRATSE